MAKTAVGLFEDFATADKVAARPGTDILKIGGLPKEHAGRYWEAVRDGRVLVAVTSAGETADRAADVMDEGGAIEVGERTARPVTSDGPRVDPSTDPGLYPRRRAVQLFTVS